MNITYKASNGVSRVDMYLYRTWPLNPSYVIGVSTIVLGALNTGWYTWRVPVSVLGREKKMEMAFS